MGRGRMLLAFGPPAGLHQGPGRAVFVEILLSMRFGGATQGVATVEQVGMLKRVAPIFPVSDLGASIEHYRRLGFATREYEGGGYGFATRDGFEIHLGVVPEPNARAATSGAYLFVEDADALAEAWRAAGAEVHGPDGTDWGQHEGAHVDPDGNVLRFGSPMA